MCYIVIASMLLPAGLPTLTDCSRCNKVISEGLEFSRSAGAISGTV